MHCQMFVCDTDMIVVGIVDHNTGDGRHVSQGAVWGVGSIAPIGTTTEDGHGHLLRSGTNARVFSTSFSACKPNIEEDLEKYQGQVACALDLDRVGRVLDFDGSKTFPRCSARKLLCSHDRTEWTGNEWSLPSRPKGGHSEPMYEMI